MTPTNPPRTSMVGYEVFWGGEGWRVKEGWRQHEGNYILRPEIRIAKVDKDWNGMLIWGVWSLTAFWKAQSSNTCRVIVSRVHFQLSEASSVSLTVECRIPLLSRQLLCSLVFEDLSLVYKEQSDVFVLIVLMPFPVQGIRMCSVCSDICPALTEQSRKSSLFLFTNILGCKVSYLKASMGLEWHSSAGGRTLTYLFSPPCQSERRTGSSICGRIPTGPLTIYQ